MFLFLRKRPRSAFDWITDPATMDWMDGLVQLREKQPQRKASTLLDKVKADKSRRSSMKHLAWNLALSGNDSLV